MLTNPITVATPVRGEEPGMLSRALSYISSSSPWGARKSPNVVVVNTSGEKVEMATSSEGTSGNGRGEDRLNQG